MSAELPELSFEVNLQPGEKLAVPSAIAESVGPGHWLVTIRPADQSGASIRGHGAFLASYAAEDEGLYDDCAAG